jgi:Cu(I)/Ag(I) efflux system periplasmic protein CusF
MSPLYRRAALCLSALTAWGLAAGPALAQAVDGEVRKIDREQSRITLRHAEIRKLEMPPMTMVFRVRDKALLETLAVGDKVQFEADKIDGQYVVTSMRKLP